MGFLSQSGRLLLKQYAGGGTFPVDMSTTAAGYKLRSGTLEPSRDLLVPDPEIGGGRDTSDAYLGAVSFSGDLEMYVRMKELGTLIKAAFGTAAAPVTVDGVTTHTITPGTTLPWLAVEEVVGNGFEAFQYTDAKVNTFHLEAEANGFLMATLGLIARRQKAGITPVNATAYDGLVDKAPMVVGTNISITYNSITLPAKSFSFDLNNNIEDDDFRLGSLYMGDMTEKSREVTVGFGIRPENSSLWRQAVYGTSAATEPGGLSTKQPLVITMSTYESIPGSTPSTPYSLVLTIPNLILEPHAVTPSGDDVIEQDITGRAVLGSGTNVVTAVLENDKETLA